MVCVCVFIYGCFWQEQNKDLKCLNFLNSVCKHLCCILNKYSFIIWSSVSLSYATHLPKSKFVWSWFANFDSHIKADHSKIILGKIQLLNPPIYRSKGCNIFQIWVMKILLCKCLFINQQAENIDHSSYTKHKMLLDKFWVLLYFTVCYFHNLISTITKINWTFTMIKCVNKVDIIKKNIHYSPSFPLY